MLREGFEFQQLTSFQLLQCADVAGSLKVEQGEKGSLLKGLNG
jgi:hypothetical protein